MRSCLAFTYLLGLVVGVGLLPTGCGGGGASKEISPVSAVSRSEFNEAFRGLTSYPAATYRSAFESLVKEDSTILEDPPRLQRALFEALKASADSSPRSLSGLLNRMSLEELWLAIINFQSAWAGRKAPGMATDASETAFPCGASIPLDPAKDTAPWNDDKSDAVRHASWMALFAKSIYDSRGYTVEESTRIAREFGVAHEEGGTSQRSQMDIANNEAGLKAFSSNPQANVEQLLTIVSSKTFEFFEIGESIPVDTDRLAYFRMRADLDKTFAGSVTNPDSQGGPWALQLSLAQCGTSIRGEWRAVRGTAAQLRRVRGTFENGKILLQVYDPYSWESDGQGFCTGMTSKMTLSGKALTGTWSGTNCPLGGSISIQSQ